MIIAAPRTGTIIDSILIVKNKFIDKNGIKSFLFLIPGIDNVLLVIKRFVKESVVLIPAKTTAIVAMSWAPKPVYFVLEEKGVIKVQPVIVKLALLH